MKKVKFNFLSLALAIGFVGAIGYKAYNEPRESNKPILFNWQSTDASGNIIPESSGGVYEELKTRSQAQVDFGCSGSGTSCAVTVDASHQRIQNYQVISHN